jgi:hypothetical protein
MRRNQTKRRAKLGNRCQSFGDFGRVERPARNRDIENAIRHRVIPAGGPQAGDEFQRNAGFRREQGREAFHHPVDAAASPDTHRFAGQHDLILKEKHCCDHASYAPTDPDTTHRAAPIFGCNAFELLKMKTAYMNVVTL